MTFFFFFKTQKYHPCILRKAVNFNLAVDIHVASQLLMDSQGAAPWGTATFSFALHSIAFCLLKSHLTWHLSTSAALSLLSLMKRFPLKLDWTMEVPNYLLLNEGTENSVLTWNPGISTGAESSSEKSRIDLFIHAGILSLVNDQPPSFTPIQAPDNSLSCKRKVLP